ncbi:Potassium channel KOR2 [Acorus calamus]|uniref:Potassium channel KOR2 n=1 Tax=Acorus calamus TaxID=4465 RepID=A0AAV9DIM6_ACOCL|nr:Potassium channel KOR2 [Acorus calamus]
MIFMWSIYSSFFTPLEFSFFKGLPDHMTNLECVQFVFFADLILQFLVAYRDPHTYKMVHNKKSIALRSLSPTIVMETKTGGLHNGGGGEEGRGTRRTVAWDLWGWKERWWRGGDREEGSAN